MAPDGLRRQELQVVEEGTRPPAPTRSGAGTAHRRGLLKALLTSGGIVASSTVLAGSGVLGRTFPTRAAPGPSSGPGRARAFIPSVAVEACVNPGALPPLSLPMDGYATVTGNLPWKGDHLGRDLYAVDLVSDVAAVYPVAPGKVVYSDYNCERAGYPPGTPCNQVPPSFYGYVIAIDHGAGLYSIYAHLAESGRAGVGQSVGYGDQIGTMSNSGCGCGAHLHFAIRQGPPGLTGRDALWNSNCPVNAWAVVPGLPSSPQLGPIMIYACSGQGTGFGPSALWLVNPSPSGGDYLIGTVQASDGSQPVITDIALAPNGTLYGISFSTMYLLDRQTALATSVGNGLGASNVNALVCDSGGNLFAATTNGDFGKVNPQTGSAAFIGSYGNGYTSSGDLAFGPGGALYASVKAPNTLNDVLVVANPSTGSAAAVNPGGNLGFRNVYGLSFFRGVLYGFAGSSGSCGSGTLIAIDPATGSGTSARCLSFTTFGATGARRRRS